MNDNINETLMNRYEGNGWSKYQILVLQQLKDHSKVLQNLNKEISDIKQTMAVNDNEAKNWRQTTVNTLESLEEKVSYILYDKEGVNQKVLQIERNLDVEERTTTKLKALWAAGGAVLVLISNLAIKIIEVVFKQQ